MASTGPLAPKKTGNVWVIAVALLIPLLISSASWTLALTLLPRASSYELEGDLYLTGFVGALSFVCGGPAAGVFLSRFLHDGRISLIDFCTLFFLVSLPAITFELVATSSSILLGFMPYQLWGRDVGFFYYSAAIAMAVAVYIVYYIVMLWAARKGLMQSIVAAVALAVTSLAAIILRIVHS